MEFRSINICFLINRWVNLIILPVISDCNSSIGSRLSVGFNINPS